ncbi:MAG: YraN family protein [Chloroflexi bacterium]|nr:MAG: YraN family protein [Chloroflexota bacterium]
MTDPRQALGLRAEEVVARWLATSGWSVLHRRWRVPEGELDLVCRDARGVLVGVEVRARSSARAGGALESLDRRRIGRLRRALGRYAAASDEPGRLRLDLVTVDRAVDGWRLARHPGIDGW